MLELATIQKVLRRSRVQANGAKRDYYFGSISSDQAKMLTFVPVNEMSKRSFLEERIEAGYQRPGSATRMGQFGDFLRDNPLSVVPPVVLSGRGKWVFEGDDLGVLRVYESAAIVDGQHRVGGFVRNWEKYQEVMNIDFILLVDLPLEVETREFLTINTTQKNVVASLTDFLLGGLGDYDEAVIAWELNQNADSPLKGRIRKTKKEPGQLFSLSAVATNVGRTFNHGAFGNLGLDEKVDIMMRYWTYIADAFPEEWADINKQTPKEFEYKLLETTGLIAWSWSGPDVLGPAFEPMTKTMNWDRVKVEIGRLADQPAVDWRKDGEFMGLTGEVGGRKIHAKLQKCLSIIRNETPNNGAVSDDQ